MEFPQITLKGTPYEKGFTHGSLCRAQVLRSIENYKKAFTAKGLDWEASQKLAERYLPVFTGEYAAYLDEMRGIADGAGLKFTEILALNLRTEIRYTSIAEEEQGEGGCTAFSAAAPATKDGITLAGQTWDYARFQRESTIIARVPAEGDTPAFLMFLEGGLVGGKGMSAAGISITLNAIPTNGRGIGIPLHIRMRRALESRTMSQAVNACLVTPIPCSANLILTCKDGLTLSLELDPAHADIIQPENGIIVHTNHFIGDVNKLTHEHRVYGSTYMRYQRMKQLMTGKKDLTMEDLEGFCKDHAGYPTSICVHPDPLLPEEKKLFAASTNYAFVCDLTHGILHYVPGNPCEGEFAELKIVE